MTFPPDYYTAIRALHADTMSIYRHGETTDADGITHAELLPAPALEGIACRFSFSIKDNADSDAPARNPIDVIGKVFCSRGHDIRAGDIVEVHASRGYAVRGIVGEPAIYDGHMELELKREANA